METAVNWLRDIKYQTINNWHCSQGGLLSGNDANP